MAHFSESMRLDRFPATRTLGQSGVFWEMFNAAPANAGIRLVLTSAQTTRLLASLDFVEAKVLSRLMEMDMDKPKAAKFRTKKPFFIDFRMRRSHCMT